MPVACSPSSTHPYSTVSAQERTKPGIVQQLSPLSPFFHDAFPARFQGEQRLKAHLAVTHFLPIQICTPWGWACVICAASKCSSCVPAALWAEIMIVWEVDRILSLPHSPDELWDKSLKKKKEASRSGFVYSAFRMIILVLGNFWLNKLQITAL